MAKKKKAKSSSPSKSKASSQPSAAVPTPSPQANQVEAAPTNLEETGPIVIPSELIALKIESAAQETPSINESAAPTNVSVRESAAETVPSPDQKSERKVAKTLLETDTSALKNAIEEAQSKTASPTPTTPAPPSEPANVVAEKVEVVQTPRKVAKTLLEADANISEPDQAIEVSPPTESIDEPKSARKVAKTLLEFSPDVADAVVAASQNPVVEERSTDGEKPKRKVAKTLLDVSVADLADLANSIGVEEEEEEVSPVVEIEPEGVPAPDAPAGPPSRKVAKTMLEVNISDLNDFAKSLSDDVPPVHAAAITPSAPIPSQPVPAPISQEKAISVDASEPRSRRVAKTMLEISRTGLTRSNTSGLENAAVSDGIQPRKINRTLSSHVLNNFSFDQLCPEDADENEEQATTLVDNSVSWEQQSSFEPPSSSEESASSEELSGTSTVWPGEEETQGDRPRKTERFIAKTMIDHNFILETLHVSMARKEERVAEKLAEKALEPPKPSYPIDDYKVAAAGCPWAWDEFDSPKDKVKYCGKCSSIVYNFQGMEMPEAEALIFKRENREKFTLYKRADGKFMTNDCPEALKQKKGKMMMILVVVFAVLLIAASFAFAPPPLPEQKIIPPSTDETLPPSEEGGTTRPPKGTGVHDGANSGSSFHYEAGKGITTAPPVQPQPQEAVPNVTPGGVDEKGQFWQYNDQPNNATSQ